MGKWISQQRKKKLKSIREGSKKKIRKKCGLLPNQGGGSLRVNKKTKPQVWRCVFFSVSMQNHSRTSKTCFTHGLEHPSAISFFRVHTTLHDILGFDTIITRYTRYFKSVKNCVFFLKACSRDSRQLAKKSVYYIFLGTLSFPVSDHL